MLKIQKPTFIVNKNICRKNIVMMASKAEANGLIFRPHFKTHQSIEIAAIFREFGVDKITVSSIEMAWQFAKEGWRDITVAFPVNILEIDGINNLAQSLTLNLLVESVDALKFLNKHLQFEVNIFIKIDTGYNRTGISPENIADIKAIEYAILQSRKMTFAGFIVHSGNTYQAKNTDEVGLIHNASIAQLKKLKHVFPNALVSIGDTPSCSLMNNYEGIDEIRPGNFVYYDATQMQIGSCKINQVAIIMACPVVAIHAERNEIVIYGGAVHFSKEYIDDAKAGQHFGILVGQNLKNEWEIKSNAYLKKLSQEHGIVGAHKDFISTIKPGDILHILPVHSCLTANLMKHNTIFI